MFTEDFLGARFVRISVSGLRPVASATVSTTSNVSAEIASSVSGMLTGNLHPLLKIAQRMLKKIIAERNFRFCAILAKLRLLREECVTHLWERVTGFTPFRSAGLLL